MDRFLARIGSGNSVALGFGFGLLSGILVALPSATLSTIGGVGLLFFGLCFVRGFFMIMAASLRAGEGPFSDFDAAKVLTRFWACPPLLFGWGGIPGFMLGAGIGDMIRAAGQA